MEAPPLKSYRGSKVGMNDRNTKQNAKQKPMKKQFSSTILRYGASLLTCCLLAGASVLRAQQFGTVKSGTPPPGRGQFIFRLDHAGGEFGLVINGSDIGTILLKACDVNQDGKVTLAELNAVAAASFMLWDTNEDGSVSGSELSTGLRELFPAPPPGRPHGLRLMNGVAVEISPDEFVTPDAQVTKRILAGADSDKNGQLTFQEVSAFLLGRCFSQWDQDGSSSLDAQELNAAFGQLAKPD
jgi:Ca2+-binding EF-hand superfamily protein